MPCKHCKEKGHNIRTCKNRTGEFESVYGNKYIYKGQMKNDKPHGLGKATYANGNKYDGEYKDGKKHGHGVMTYANGDKYDGEYKDGKKNGHGVYTNTRGYKYDGEWKDDSWHGHGVCTWASGHKYDGEWKDDDMINGIFKKINTYEYYINGKINKEKTKELNKKIEKLRLTKILSKYFGGDCYASEMLKSVGY